MELAHRDQHLSSLCPLLDFDSLACIAEYLAQVSVVDAAVATLVSQEWHSAFGANVRLRKTSREQSLHDYIMRRAKEPPDSACSLSCMCHFPGFAARDLHLLMPMVGIQQAVQLFCLRNTQLRLVGAQILASHAWRLENLHRLILVGADLDDAATIALARGVVDVLPKLDLLDLSRNRIGSRGIQALLPVLVHSVLDLCLAQNLPLTIAAGRAIIRSDWANNSMQLLTLPPIVGRASMAALASLAICPGLKELRIKYNRSKAIRPCSHSPNRDGICGCYVDQWDVIIESALGRAGRHGHNAAREVRAQGIADHSWYVVAGACSVM